MRAARSVRSLPRARSGRLARSRRRAQSLSERSRSERSKSERLKSERDPKLVDAINAEVKKLSELLFELIGASRKNTGPVAKADKVVWPRDLSAQANSAGDWGTDPAEVGVE